jgi:uroporphyrinogen-III synthase
MGPWVLATRGPRELESLARLLAAEGITVLPYQVLREAPADDPGAWTLVAGLRQDPCWVVFTSRRAAPALLVAGERRGMGPWLLSLPAAAVGEATASAARAAGFTVALVGDAGGRALAALLATRLAAGSTVLHACAREHRDEFGVALAGSGSRIVPIVVYSMDETPAEDLPPLPSELPRAVLLTSPRATRAYLCATGGCYAAVPHIALGATTAAAAEDAGLEARVLSRQTNEAVMEELCRICS